MAAGNDDDEGGGGDGDPDLCAPEGTVGPGGRRSVEKAVEEAASTGFLNLSGRRMKELPGCARNHDLSDLTRADLSRNRFAEIPGDVCRLISLESLNLYHNCLRSVPPAASHLQVLTYLNPEPPLLSSLPPHVCRLPLTVLIASNNRLTSLPEELGAMTTLRQLDVSCNEIQTLPAQMGSLLSLRELNVRRNQLSALPEELAELPLTRLDFSCNRVTRIPICYRHMRHLQTVTLDNNPLQFPPAQICLKGKVHIFKYLNLEACSQPDAGKLSRPTSFTACLTDDIYPSRTYGGLDSGFNSVDSGSKRWSGNESADDFSDLSFRIAGLGRDVRQSAERHNGLEGDAEHTDFIDGGTNGEEEDDARSESGLQMVVTPQDKRRPDHHSTPRTEEKTLIYGAAASPPSPSTRQDLAAEERRRPETLLIWKERERQQLQQKQEGVRRASVPRGESIQRVPSYPSTPPPARGAQTDSSSDNCRSQDQGCQTANSVSPPAGSTGRIGDPSACSSHKPSSFLFRSCSRGAVRMVQASGPSEQSVPESRSPVRLRSSQPLPDEKALLEQLRQDIESRLKVTLQEPLCEALSNGVALCQLLNHLRPRSIPSIHVPSPAVPKLNAVKRRRNVDSFLEACRKLGVPEDSICSPHDILDCDGVHNLFATVQSLLRQSPPSSRP
ncbi:leucine-rich repeat and calponin homology domain-containing protein 4 [Spea bombifrons]|uniref:leucine-rich repeat and calponin homology domain-containing protein 4 n=1 Tax=Spea bombifrons TaxID=233779 RepID=UPI002349FEDB|nr:leucine-rich repeat and calponin homology domain-containing protein 4 [Spea bombifrons]